MSYQHCFLNVMGPFHLVPPINRITNALPCGMPKLRTARAFRHVRRLRAFSMGFGGRQRSKCRYSSLPASGVLKHVPSGAKFEAGARFLVQGSYRPGAECQGWQNSGYSSFCLTVRVGLKPGPCASRIARNPKSHRLLESIPARKCDPASVHCMEIFQSGTAGMASTRSEVSCYNPSESIQGIVHRQVGLDAI